ncbi:MAG: TAT-variant-translocated molybdopterin oxidoreductase [Phycisphaerales bacterium]
MSNIDQCPSSKKDGKPVDRGNAAHLAAGAGTRQAYWRGLDELADTPEFRERLHREFPAGASEMLDESGAEGDSRRDFLKLMGAGLALAGVSTLAACRRPDHTILPYAKNVPEEIIPGKSLYYATSMPLPGGGAEGLLIETHEGRPTKVEGNPLHPVNQGKSSLWSQAMILGLYDPDRLAHPVYASDGGVGTEATWDDFALWWKRQTIDPKGKGVAVVYDKAGGPTREFVAARLRTQWPDADIFGYDALENEPAAVGSRMAFGRSMREVLAIEKARVIVSIDRDFLQFEGGAVRNARGWGASRHVNTTADVMSRLYCVESGFSITGAAADHRLALAPSLLPNFVVALARFVSSKKGTPASKPLIDALAGLPADAASSAIDQRFVEELGKDLLSDEARGASLIVAGRTLPAPVHALVAALNAALGNVGTTVSYVPASEDEGSSSMERIAILAERMRKGEISTAIFLGCNPVFSAPANCDFAGALAKVKTRIALSVDRNETTAACQWRLNGCHVLEAWGDTEAIDGTIAPIQPMIAPLFAGRSDIELLALLAGEEKPDGFELVRAAWKARLGAGFSEKTWRRALFDGVLAGTAKEAGGAVNFENVGKLLAQIPMGAAPTESKLDVAFAVASNYDGRFANNGWLQELPEPSSHVVWDNPALISVKTAQRLGLMQTPETDKKPKGRVATISAGGRTLRIAFWAIPGLPDNTIILHPGSGRRVVGLVGERVGFDVFGLRTTSTPWVVAGASVAPVTEGSAWHNISCPQTHWSMEGRAIVREVDHQAWAATTPKQFEQFRTPVKDSYGRTKTLTFAERIEGSELIEMPATVGIYPNPFNASPAEPAPQSKYTVKPQWGMSIDLAKCTGCNVCTIACQSENNIPIVGKIEVNKGREMHWIRVDRYFRAPAAEGARGHGPGAHHAEDWTATGVGMSFQPVACVQCENAPCETVCPVNATVHGEEGHNYMTYNRCIGTRYCANNCPYKVRRFNFFDYGVAKFRGGLRNGIEDSVPGVVSENLPENHNLIPPRLRKKLDEISKMGMNPNVTVRSRGVMEKCTYCIQRTNEAKIEFKLQHPGQRPTDGMPDGIVQTACQQACPTDAISFGDILDAVSHNGKGSRVRQERDHQRSYLLLGFLNTRPRTTYMIGMKNPNKNLRAPEMNPLGEVFDPGHHHEHDGHNHASSGRAGQPGYRLSLPVLTT